MTSRSGIQLLAAANDDSSSSLPALNASKTVTPNSDGTYKLNLSVQGAENTSEETNIKKANVVIVMDTSDSMDAGTSYQSYTYNWKTYDSDTTYYGKYKGQYFALSGRDSYNWYYTTSGGSYYYDGDVYTASSTRLSDERTALKSMVSSLLSHNDSTKENQSDVVEISFITFASTASLRVSKSTNVNTLNTIIDSNRQDGVWYKAGYIYKNSNNPNYQPYGYDTYASNTNWQWALSLAQREAASYKNSQPNEDTYVIFLTDGEATAYGTTLSSVAFWDAATSSNATKMMQYAEPSARSIVKTNGATLYNVFTYGDNDSIQYLQRLTNYAYDGWEDNNYTKYNNTYFYDARDTSAITSVFSNLINTISQSAAYGKISITDGITGGVTSTSVTTNGSPQNILYTVTDKSGGTVFTATQTDSGMTINVNGVSHVATRRTNTVDGTSYTYYSYTDGDTEYKIAPATVNNGTITWDLAGLGPLPGDYVYNLSCTVWPNQIAYDLVAELNNGSNTRLTWNDSSATTHTDSYGSTYSIGGFTDYPYIARYGSNGSYTYAVMSNSSQSVSYAEATTNNGTTTYGTTETKELATPDPMALTDTVMNVKKTWQASLDTSQLKFGDKVTLELHRDSDTTAYKSFEFTAGEATNGTYTSEAQTVHLAAGLMVSVAKAQPGVTSSTTVTIGNTQYYVLNTGHDYTLTEPNTNYHWEFTGATYHPMIVDGQLMNATVDSNGNITALSEFSGDVTGTNTLRGGINVRKVVVAKDGTTDISSRVSNQEFTLTAHLKDKNGKAITYSSYNITDKNSATKEQQDAYPIWYNVLQDSNCDGVADTNTDGNLIYISTNGQMLQDGESFTIKTGQIIRLVNVPSGTQYSFTEDTAPTGYEKVSVNPSDTQTATLNAEGDVVVTNKLKPLEITVMKTADDGTALTGAVFTLTKQNSNGDYTADGLTTTSVTVNSADGIKISDLDIGDYKLSETTAPAGYIVENADTYFHVGVQDGAAVITLVGESDTHYNAKASSEGSVVTIKNKPGEALPNTGGHGTLPYTLGGMFLVIAAGAIYLITKKRYI